MGGSDCGWLRIGDRQKFRLEMREDGLPDALHGALEMDGLNAKHGKEAATGEQTSGAWAAGTIEVLAQSAAKPGVFAAGDFFSVHKIKVQNVFGFGAEYVGEAAGHAGTEIEAERAENEDDAAGHIFATVLANAFDHGEGAAVANGEAFAGAACDEKLAGGCAIQNRVASEDVATARGAEAGGDGDGAAAEAFADVVVGFAVEFEIDPGAEERAEALASTAVKFFVDGGAGGAASSAVAGHFAAESGADAAVGIANY